MREKWGWGQTESVAYGAERWQRVTEGLGSAMLSIWLRNALCFWTVLQEHRDYTPYIKGWVNSHCRGQHDRENNKPTPSEKTALIPMSWQLTWGCPVLGPGSGGLRNSLKPSQRKEQSPFIMSTPILNTMSTPTQNITPATTTTTWRRSSWMNLVISQVSHF